MHYFTLRAVKESHLKNLCCQRKTTIIESFLIHSDDVRAITFTMLGGELFHYRNCQNFFSYIELKTDSQEIPLAYSTGESIGLAKKFGFF